MRYWGDGPFDNIYAEEAMEKVLSLLEAKIKHFYSSLVKGTVNANMEEEQEARAVIAALVALSKAGMTISIAPVKQAVHVLQAVKDGFIEEEKPIEVRREVAKELKRTKNELKRLG